MEIREALRTMNPSLVLQRAAADEIAKLDKEIEMLNRVIDAKIEEIRNLDLEIADADDEIRHLGKALRDSERFIFDTERY